MPEDDRSQWVTPAEAARVLNVHRSSVCRAIASGRIRAHRCKDGRLRLNLETLRNEWAGTTCPGRTAVQLPPRSDPARLQWVRHAADSVVQETVILNWDSPNADLINDLSDRYPDLMNGLYDVIWDAVELAIDRYSA